MQLIVNYSYEMYNRKDNCNKWHPWREDSISHEFYLAIEEGKC